MALAILLSHPEIILKALYNSKSQLAALTTSVPTVLRWWSIKAVFSCAVAIFTPNVKLTGCAALRAVRVERRVSERWNRRGQLRTRNPTLVEARNASTTATPGRSRRQRTSKPRDTCDDLRTQRRQRRSHFKGCYPKKAKH